MPSLAMREAGSPNEVMYDCPGLSRVVDYPTSWYRLPDIPGFLVCTYCYTKHIAGTCHASAFSEVTLPEGTCYFNVPRVVDSLWLTVVGDLHPFREFAKRRVGIPSCAEGTKWFEAPGGKLPVGFRVCEACYEDHIQTLPALARSFHVCPVEIQGDGGCQLRFPYLVRAWAECASQKGISEDDSWAEFAAAVKRRMSLATCDGTTVPLQSRPWRSPRGQPAMIFCEACFLDQVGMTPFEREFESGTPTAPPPVPPPRPSATASRLIGSLLGGASSVDGSNQEQGWACQAQNVAVAVLLSVALQRQDFHVFLRGAATIVASSPCTEQGIAGGSWFTLAGRRPLPNFYVCAACYVGIIQPYGLDRFFTAAATSDTIAPSPPTTPHLCAFHPSSPNFRSHILRLSEAVDTGLWPRFASSVRKTAAPPCPRSNLTPNLIWYGYQDCGICPACYEEVCADTALAPHMPIQAALVTGPTMCSMYSPRMRALYADACAANDPSRLVEFAHARALKHANTLLRADAMRRIRTMQTLQAVHQGSLSAMYSAGQSFSLAAGTTSAYAYGNNALGWHPTQSGAMAAQAMHNMQTGFAQANGADDAMEIARLEAMWLEVE